jgi:superkiller protein 3
MRGRRLLLAVVLGAGAVAGALGWFFLRPERPPEPPVLDLNGVEPAVATALESARDAVKQRPRSGAAWGLLAKALLANGYDEDALVCLVQAERLAPDEPRWPYLRASRLVLKDREAAIPVLRRAVDLCDRFDQKNTTPRLLLAEVLLERGELDEVKALCRRVLELEPDNARAHFGLGAAALAADDLEASLQHFTRCAASPFGRQRACQQLVIVSRRMGNTPAAEELGRQASQGPPDQPWNDPYVEEYRALAAGRQDRFLNAEHLQAAGRLDASAGILRELVEDFPDNRSHIALGRALIELGNPDGAERALREAVRHAPEQASSHYALSVALFRQGEALDKKGQPEAARAKFEAAARSAAQAVELKPDHALAHLFRGRCRLRVGQREAALGDFRTACRCRPELSEPYLRLGEALAEAGQKAEGLKYLRVAAELAHPNDQRARAALERWGGPAPGPK